ncbi:MAG: NAD(P)/FAD-dependent oxidoreductase [Bacteroidota bacterium]
MYIIVGAGIAGLSIAFRLEERNIPYIIVDSGNNQSSQVAAGIINPIVFRRVSLSWRVAELLPEAKNFYRRLEQQLGGSFLRPIPIRRAFAHEQELDLWLEKQSTPEFSPYLKELDEKDASYNTIKQRCGTGLVKDSWWVDTKALLSCWHQKLREENKLRTEIFDYAKVDPEQLTYDGMEFEELIFCEGFRAKQNPWFSHLPVQATKGELLTVKNLFLPENELYNYKCFVLPTGNHEFKVGATYAWNSPDTELTFGARQELEGHFQKITDTKYEIVKHEAGVRPTTPDRKPMLGRHPVYPKLSVYNGLGTKGYLISPLLSKEFVSYLIDGNELHPEICMQRFEKN